MANTDKTFGEDVEFLSKHTEIVRLETADGLAKVALAPRWQGRVMSSTCRGDQGTSFGWVNYSVVEKGISPKEKRTGLERHIHVFGGEERLWLGPEGGQFALFFPPKTKSHEFKDWRTPAILDTVPFAVERQAKSEITFRQSGCVTNRCGTELVFELTRHVALWERGRIAERIGVDIPAGVKGVAFESANTLKNTSQESWKPESGAPSIWMLGMFKPADDVVMVVPFENQSNGVPVNTDYFGDVASDRLQVGSGVALFKGDGRYRAKIGIPAARVKPWCGSYSPSQQTLTLLHFNMPYDVASLPYVRSQWEHHENPYSGDVINCYNDGPPEPDAKPLGPFYELESSSPALALAPAESYSHIQTTMHFQGSEAELGVISEKVLGVCVSSIKNAFRPETR